MPQPAGHLRIGELSRRVGVSPELLRAWERRYGLMQPSRSAGGFRLYSDADEARIRRMQEHLEGGLSAAEAAQAALSVSEAAETPTAAGLPEAVAQLLDALERYDEVSAHGILDRLLATYSTQAVLVEVVLPVLRSVGEQWADGEVSVAQEHFASHVLRGRLLGLAREWGRGIGPIAVLACPPDERHDLPLIMFGIALRSSGWRIAFLGADTPIATIEQAVVSLEPRAVVLSTVETDRLQAVERDLAALTARTTVAVGGAGADSALAEQMGAIYLPGDPVAAATEFARMGP